MLQRILDSIFPRTCPVCGEIVMPRGQLICRDCLSLLSFVRSPVCEKCGKEILTGSRKLCYDCAHRERTFTANRALLNYEENARRCMAKIKYKNCREHTELFGKMMAIRLCDFILEMNPDCLVPVPAHISRQKMRGYNQAELIAEVIGRETDIPVRADLLIRRKHTAAMKNLGAEDRLNNLREAFAVCDTGIPKEIKRIMLVDDIFTTGATIEACSKILCAEGVETSSICVCIGSDI